MAEIILGISTHSHDSAACLLVDGKIIAAAQEERFTRKKNDASFPKESIRYCLRAGQLSAKDIAVVAYYENPFLKLDRLFQTYLAFAPRGLLSFLAASRSLFGRKLFVTKEIRKTLHYLEEDLSSLEPDIAFVEHHLSHAASAFLPSGFDQAAVLCVDGVGEWSTTSAWLGNGGKIRQLWDIKFPHSLGMLYSAFTYFAGFKVNSGEYKLMGLAPYGRPSYVDKIYDHLIDLKEDGTFRLNLAYFDYPVGFVMTSKLFDGLFDGPPRKAETVLGRREMDLARSIQVVTEEIMLRLARTIRRETGMKNLCLAGGVALNCVSNGRLLRDSGFENIWIQPAAGDAGGALGAALWIHHCRNPEKVKAISIGDSMSGAYLGPWYENTHVKQFLSSVGATFEEFEEDELLERVANALSSQKIIGWFQGRMEFGPRALGARSILADPRNPDMQRILNHKIKFRESFRPFAPMIRRERVSEYFDLDRDSPYMLFTATVSAKRRKCEQSDDVSGFDLLKVVRSEIPAVTHVDFSARVQTVHPETNPRIYRLLKRFESKTGSPVLVNTSFNIRGEPIVCSPEDAYRCFMRTEIDWLVLEDYIVRKEANNLSPNNRPWRETL